MSDRSAFISIDSAEDYDAEREVWLGPGHRSLARLRVRLARYYGHPHVAARHKRDHAVDVRKLCLSTANRREDEEKERAAQLPEPSGLDDAARQDALAVADDLFGFELRDVAGAHLEPAGHHLVGMLP